MKQVLALDFDGVLSDSLLEAYLITWRIAGEVDPAVSPDGVRPPDIDNIAAFRDSHPGHWSHFSSLVPFGNRAEDYMVIFRAVHQGLRFDRQEQFNEYREQNFEQGLLDEFHERFYEVRYGWAENDHERWLALNEAYPGVREAVRGLAERFTPAIATSKDSRTVLEVLESYGLAGLFDREAVLDKSMGGSKRAHLERLRDHFGVTFEQMTFIDDKVAHLIDCDGLGVRLMLSGWGYNGEQEAGQALERGFTVLGLEDFPDISLR